ncbi:MAG: tail fiber protein [Bacteroidota bacterium]
MYEIKMYAGTFPPAGWMFCEGQILEKRTYPRLFNAIGTIYGGDGHETFALPDFRGRAPIAHGQGSGLSPRKMGDQGGEADVTLQPIQMPSHSHFLGSINLKGKFAIMATTSAGNTNDPSNAVLASSEDPVYVDQTAARDTFELGGSYTLTTTGYVEPQGGAQSHNNMQPYLAIRFIIRVQ